MSKKALIVGAATIAVVALIFFHYYIGERDGRNTAISSFEGKSDTLVIHDTIVENKPVYVAKKVVDTLRIPVVDTIRITDTLYIELEREQVEWRDSLCSVYASGILPSVDSVAHYIREREITTYVPQIRKTRWGIGIQAGYGATFSNGVQFAPYIGVGISYDFLAW